MLPDGNGLDVLRFIKERYPNVSCIMLSALGKEEDKVSGLNMGADDYVSKPFSVIELAARINVRLRSKRSLTKIIVDNIKLDTETMEVELNGEKLTLNRKEFELLRYFMEHKGKVLSREKLLSDVWDYNGGESRTLDNHVARLRKLGIGIETVFGVGYKL